MPKEIKENNQEKKKGRPLKFNKPTSVLAFRVPEDSKEIYKENIDKSVIQLATDRGDVKE